MVPWEGNYEWGETLRFDRKTNLSSDIGLLILLIRNQTFSKDHTMPTLSLLKNPFHLS